VELLMPGEAEPAEPAGPRTAAPLGETPVTTKLPRRPVAAMGEEPAEAVGQSPWPTADAEWFYLDTRPLPEEQSRSPLVG
jgi:hypothetical protein